MVNDLKISQPTMSMWKFADDTSISEVIPKYATGNGNTRSGQLVKWKLVSIESCKCKELIINFSKQPDAEEFISLNSQHLERVPQAKILGVTITKDLRRNVHIENIVQKHQSPFISWSNWKKLTWNLVHLLNSTLLVSGQFQNILVKFYIQACPSIYQTRWNVSRREGLG